LSRSCTENEKEKHTITITTYKKSKNKKKKKKERKKEEKEEEKEEATQTRRTNGTSIDPSRSRHSVNGTPSGVEDMALIVKVRSMLHKLTSTFQKRKREERKKKNTKSKLIHNI
jgi:hypothetical protein